MRASVWLWASVLSACGNVERDPPGSAAGGTSTAGANSATGAGTSGVLDSAAGELGVGGDGRGGSPQSAGGGVNVGGPIAGTGGTAAGGIGALGGTSGSGGVNVGGTSGSGGVNAGGALVLGGEGGAGGDAPACGPYLACGCGCCPGRTTVRRCSYPDVDGHLDGIIARDREAGASPECASAGCSSGIDYVCCATDPNLDAEATYTLTATSTALDRFTIQREASDGQCTSITFVNPSIVQTHFSIEAPARWGVEAANGGGCFQSGAERAIGGVGRVSWQGEPCAADFDFTLFFSAGDAPVRAVRFHAQGAPIAEIGSLRCD